MLTTANLDKRYNAVINNIFVVLLQILDYTKIKVAEKKK